MHIGVVFPQTEIGSDPGVVRDFLVTADALGFAHLSIFDHVIGADRGSRPGWDGFYDSDDPFLEPFVLLAHAAALTSMELSTSVLVLPQRQTVLVAKQAATLDVLCGGRLRLGVGVGWNAVEYAALGRSTARRGPTLDDQIRSLRSLWTRPTVTLDLPDGTIDRAGLNPLPVQRPIPIWVGSGGDPRGLRRVGTLADGFLPGPHLRPGPLLDDALAIVRAAAAEHSRPEPPMDAMVGLRRFDFDRVTAEIDDWRRAGAERASIYTMRQGLSGTEHVAALPRIAAALALTRR